jgi:hypothetical protein
MIKHLGFDSYKEKRILGTVDHTCNPKYRGDRGRKIGIGG